MPRTLADDVRAALDAPAGEDQPLVFLTLDHDDLEEPIRVVGDFGTVGGAPAEWIYDGDTYLAFPFTATLLSDGDGPPRATIEIANVDRRIGEAVRDLATPPRLTMVALLPSDFDTDASPRTETGTAVPIWSASGLVLREVEGDAVAIRGTVESVDDTQEPWPAVRATQALLPGLYR